MGVSRVDMAGKEVPSLPQRRRVRNIPHPTRTHDFFRYLFQARSVPCLYREALRTPIIHLEDVYVTGVLASACAIERRLDDRYHPNEWYQCRITSTNFVLVHYKRGKRKEKLYALLASERNVDTRIAGILRHNCVEGHELW